MSINAEIVGEYVGRNAQQLARLMKYRRPEAITVVDNSIPASFIGRRFKQEEYRGLNISQIWAIEEGFRREFLNSLEDGVSFPAETRREYAEGTRKLISRSEDPVKAIKFRWGASKLELPESTPRVYDLAKQELERFIEGSLDCRATFRALPTEAYMDDHDWDKFRKIKDIIRGVAMELKAQNGEKLGRDGENNDADIFAMSYVLADKGPVQILTGDRHFLGIHSEVYKNDALIAAVTDTVAPRYDLTIILDTPKRPWILKKPKLEL